jgi:CheY-like chemotaxis protein
LARKILLADDSVTAQNMGRKILSDAGYEVITVNNGSAALKKIAEQRPDLIVLDVYMPGYSGLEVCQRLKENPDTARMPVLLTVGKLEPFKPEEAKRVGADAFIVKPFEASELLSALSKLEDRIIPRAEPSKPGRFARAIAAVEEQSRTEPAEEDSSWKNRISFPPKNKPKVEDEPETVEPYAPTARQNRAVEPPPTSFAEMPVTAGSPDVPALPKDVTPEELAALAAAVAQVQAKQFSSEGQSAPSQEALPSRSQEVIETKAEAAPPPVEAATSPVVTFGDLRAEEEYKAELQRAAAAEAKSWEKVGGKHKADEHKREEAQLAEAKLAEAKLEVAKLEEARLEAAKFEAAKLEAARLEQAKADEAKAVEARISQEKIAEEKLAEEKLAAAKLAEQKLVEEKIAEEARIAEEKRGEEKTYAAGPVSESTSPENGAPSHADLIAAVASLEPANGKGWDAAAATRSGQEDVPVTMAAAAGVGSDAVRSHWTAVPVALDRDEVSISLEREMEKAYAAMVAAESAPLASAASAPVTAPLPEAAPLVSSASSTYSEPTAASPVIAQPAAIEAGPTPEAERVSEPITVAPIITESSTPPETVAPAPVAAHESVLAHALSAVANAVREAVGIGSHQPAAEVAGSPGTAAAAAAEGTTDFEEYARVLPDGHRPAHENQQADGNQTPVAKHEDSSTQAVSVEAGLASAPTETLSAPANLEVKSETSAHAGEPQTFAESAAHAKSSHESQSAEPAPPVAESAAAQSDPAVTRRGEIDMREPDAAAAWASWRQIRDTQKPSAAGSQKSKQQDDDDDDYPAPVAEPAAMAVAAGAEKTPEETPASSAHPDAIASIVDSVLADLRPKIVAEISKKLNEKK